MRDLKLRLSNALFGCALRSVILRLPVRVFRDQVGKGASNLGIRPVADTAGCVISRDFSAFLAELDHLHPPDEKCALRYELASMVTNKNVVDESVEIVR